MAEFISLEPVPQRPKDEYESSDDPKPDSDDPKPDYDDPGAYKCTSAKCCRGLLSILLFISLLSCIVPSKMSLINLTNQLRILTWTSNESNSSENWSDDFMSLDQISTDNYNKAVTIYWYILLIFMIPNLLTFLRSLFFGVLCKSMEIHSWRAFLGHAFIAGILAIGEVIFMSLLVFLVICQLSPGIAILFLNGVLFVKINARALRDFCRSLTCNCKAQSSNKWYTPIEGTNSKGNNADKTKQDCRCTCTCWLTWSMCITVWLVFVGMFICGLIGQYGSESPTIYLASGKAVAGIILGGLALLLLAPIWTEEYHNCISNSPLAMNRYINSFITSTIRLIAYPLLTYPLFRYYYEIDPWCLNDGCTINLQGEALPALLLHIFTTLGAYILVWIACAMGMRRVIVVALFVSTLVSLVTYYCCTSVSSAAPSIFLNITEHNELDLLEDPFSKPFIISALVVGLALWCCLAAIIIRRLWHTKGNILLRDADMFHSPHYDGFFSNQYMLLNMRTSSFTESDKESKKHKIYICSTMYRESEHEMKELLASLKNTATNLDTTDITFESHIVFDNGVSGETINRFAQTLLNLIHTDFGTQEKLETSYGLYYKWESISDNETPFPLIVHLKDVKKVKKNKRWSQVMYMKYIIDHCLKGEQLENAYILTTDADITFDKSSIDSLLDRMKSNPSIGGVCSRTHPKGSGVLYWFQRFDYAIGHWLQKPAEDIMGCVLCCPGCFSMFRCSALKEVFEEYSKPANSGNEFLMRNMGEDRWLCTLLIKEGYLLVYCALSSIYTYCPETFQQFYSQRRRWIPSTIANIASLITQSSTITKNNSHVSILFILYQSVIVFSTAIAPATVVFVISTGLKSAYGISETLNQLIITALILIGIFYGIVCIFASQKTQIDVAKIFSFLFIILMILVIVGLVKEIVHKIFPDPTSVFLAPANCSLFKINSSQFLECKLVAKYLNSLPNVSSYYNHIYSAFINLIYMGLFALIFVTTTLLHWREWADLLHSITYFLALPCAYLLLPIYSAANLNIQNWGTREERDKTDEGLIGLLKKARDISTSMIRCCYSNNGYKRVPQEDLEEPFTEHIELQTESDYETDTSGGPGAEHEGESSLNIQQRGPHNQEHIAIINFWNENVMSSTNIKYEEPNIEKINAMERSLRQLRNTVIGAFFVVNIMWFLLLYTIQFSELGYYIQETRAFQILFLAIYAFLLIIQFLMMLCHRMVTFIRYINSLRKN